MEFEDALTKVIQENKEYFEDKKGYPMDEASVWNLLDRLVYEAKMMYLTDKLTQVLDCTGLG